MNAVPKELPTPTSPANDQIIQFGRKIFQAIGQERPSAFSKNFWSGTMMEWSMKRPEFKINMFRLVDVLPTLTTSAAIAKHVTEYLAGPAGKLSGILRWGATVNPRSIRAHLTAFMVRKGVKEMAAQFIAGASAERALPVLRRIRKDGLAFTVDLLGEFCVSEQEAVAYLNRYLEALTAIGKTVPTWKEGAALVAGHSGEQTPVCVSVKLSALYSQTNVLNFDRSVAVLSERLSQLARKALEVNAQLYVDAEDSANNQIIYEVFERVFSDPEFKALPVPGIVVQAYARESRQIIERLIQFARRRGSPIAIRLVKGAYLDYETVVADQSNLPCPLFSRKESTDANYEELSRLLLDNTAVVLPAFGSHNVRSLSQACVYAEQNGIPKTAFELQMLYGMAEPIARAFSSEGYLVRLYVPLGEMLPGMGYLVRRLLENTSNESFLRHTFFDANEVGDLLRAPTPEPQTPPSQSA
jgi:RHH-type proline utilization regulon transcriptional repressor/proline dehydrogenase/delta 1-pyrroline-5-carboxylate dehydrogenase